MPTLTQASSAAEFFKMIYDRFKSNSPRFNIELFSEELNIGVSTLKMILSGQRQPTSHQALAAAKALRLSPDETEYLENMCLRDFSESDWEKSYYARKLKRIKSQLKVERVETSDKLLLADPLAIPLLVYLTESETPLLEDLSTPDVKELAKIFNTSADLVQSLLQKFKDSKVIQKSKDGKFHIVFSRINYKELQKRYLKNLMEATLQRINNEYGSPTSHFVAYTFSTNESALSRLNMDLKSLMEKYMAEDPKPEKNSLLVQASFQLFPIAKIPKKQDLDESEVL